MRSPHRSNYTTLDFMQWQAAGSLIISPKFQRRAVWGRPAQSYLIDTLLLGLPVPPIYLRVVQDREKGMVREVVDGQQRMSAVLSYINNKFALSKNIESDTIGKRFSDLSEEHKNAILQYPFICEVFQGVEDKDILKIFARLNTNSVKLNAQELRNGKYFGEFKNSIFDIAYEHLEFWRIGKIFTEQAIARMQEVELTSELMIAIISGIQDKKKSIDSFYERFDDEFPNRADNEEKFRAVIDAINEGVGEDLSATEFRRVPLFYSLFTAVAHRMFSVPNVALPTPASGRLTRNDLDGLQEAVRELSNIVSEAKEGENVKPERYRNFVSACLRQTDNVRPRSIRLETIYRQSFD